MKRLSKKLIALVMAMTMVLAMGVTSFAATPNADGKYPIEVKYDSNFDGVADQTTTVYLNADGSADNVTKYAQPGSNTIENYGVATAFDALYATGKVNNYYEVQYVDSSWQPIDTFGIAFDKFNGKEGTSETLSNGKTRYYYWNVAIKSSADGSYTSANDYATHYKASDIYGVQVVYTYMDY